MLPIALLSTVGGLLKKHWQLAILAVVLVTGYLYINNLRAERDAAIVSQHNAEADRDSLKLVYADDSTQIYQQYAWAWDEIKALRYEISAKGETKVAAKVTVRPKPKQETHVDTLPPPPEESPLLVLQDSLAGPPADVYASVLLTFRPDSSMITEWAWLTKPWPIELQVDVGCKERLKPDVIVSVPAWVTVDSVRTNVQTKVCGETTKKHGLGWWALRVGGVLGLGAAIGAAASN